MKFTPRLCLELAVSRGMKGLFPLCSRSLQQPPQTSPVSSLRFCHQTKDPSSAINSPHFRLVETWTKQQFLSMLDPCTTDNLLPLNRIHARLLVLGHSWDLLLQTKLLNSYGSAAETRHARMVFDRIPHPDLYSFKEMLKCYLMNGSDSEAIAFYRHIRVCDNVVFSLVLKACTKLLDLGEGRKVHCRIAKVGNPDVFLLNVLVDMYAKCGDLGSSMRVFDEISDDGNVVSWTSIITGCNQNSRPGDGLVLFNRMRLTGVEPNEHTMGSLLTSCVMTESSHQGKWIHGAALKLGMSKNAFVATSLLDMYAKCGEITDARSFFDELDKVDLVFWTAMIVGYAQKGCPTEALKFFCDKKWAAFVPNSVTIASVLSASGKLGALDLGRSIHVLAFKLGIEEVEGVRNSLVDMYAKCCAISEAEYVFERILHKDVVAWNAMIAGFSQNGFGYKALALFNWMRLDGWLPDAITVVGALSACACLGDLCVCSSFHCYAMKHNFTTSVYVSTALLNLYNKCGDPISARRIFDDTSNRNTVTWCAMMGGYGMQGDSAGSLDLFSKMMKDEMKPNHVTFTNILSACSHAGIINEGKKYFERMIQNHNIVPSKKHYVCMVDMLARAGKIEEAFEFIEGMPVEADVSVWGALLHGCLMHSRLDIGEVAAKRMMKLKPGTPDYYVLMANMYASGGRWADADKIRELMKEKGMIKSLGSSIVSNDGLNSIVLSA